MQDDLELDALFLAAKLSIRADKAQAAKQPKRTKLPDAAPAEPLELFTRAENWKRTRGVALIHEETQTLLGNFSEYVHISVAGCRKLLRESAPILVEASESVSGDWWVREEAIAPPREEWHTKRSAVVHLHLPQLGVHSPACPVTVFLSYGGITRVELEFDTQFAQLDDATQEQLLFLPAGVNVLPQMSQDSKVELKVELSL